MAKGKGGNSAVADKPKTEINPHDVDLVAETKDVQVSNEPIAAEVAVDDSGRIFQDEQLASANGKLTTFAIARLFRQGNVRTAATEQIPQMVASLKRHGFKRNHPIVVSLKGKAIDKAGHDGLVLCGNRRVLGVEWLYANEREEFDRIFPDGLIPAIIHENLTEEQEALIRIDHGADEDRVPLDEFGEFLAVKQLVKAGYNSQAGIAEKLGKFTKDRKTGAMVPARSWVQPRVNLARMPQFVQDEMQTYCEGGDSPLRWTDIAGLFKTYNAEFMSYPNGNGPDFQKQWTEVTARNADGGKPKETVSLTGPKAADVAKTLSSRILREAVVALVKPEYKGLTDADASAVRAETAEAVLAEIAEYLGQKDFQELCDNAAQAKGDKQPA